MNNALKNQTRTTMGSELYHLMIHFGIFISTRRLNYLSLQLAMAQKWLRLSYLKININGGQALARENLCRLNVRKVKNLNR